jgi:mannose-6-phosphate isomerase
LYGRHHPQPKFPLLLKFLDCHLVLSVQAHPNDRQAQALTPPDLGKTEAWYVLEAEPGSRIYAGLKDGVDRPALAAALEDGSVADCLHAFSPRVGDCVFIPAGTVHALGAGLMVVEIQQSSNTTFRLFDWNRVGPDGQPRPLHVSDALNVIDYSRGPMMPVSANVDDAGVRRLVTCDKFQLEEWRISQSRAVGGDGRFHLIAVVSGELMIDGDPVGTPLTRGDTSLIPAAVATSLIPAGSATVLVGSLP